MIIGREKEITTLHELMSAEESQFVAVYGRRRVAKTFAKNEDYCYTMLRFQDRKHEIASSMTFLMTQEIEFLEKSVMGNPNPVIRVDSLITQ
ncbi:MAG: hypothetical protein MJY68_04120 [Bacteroidaceae bacterium]|nr:hypothetical protein [Bacteroidaceae bacterium]